MGHAHRPDFTDETETQRAGVASLRSFREPVAKLDTVAQEGFVGPPRHAALQKRETWVGRPLGSVLETVI